jgi:hypothetical protein
MGLDSWLFAATRVPKRQYFKRFALSAVVEEVADTAEE